jgi:hypothetical protein
MHNADFAWLNYDTAFAGASPEATRSFFIEDAPLPACRPGTPVAAEGYILVQIEVGWTEDVPGDTEVPLRILVNGNHLPAIDLVSRAGRSLWMDRIPPGFLKKGENRVTVRCGARDAFRVANIVVQWRERRY